MRTRFLCFFTLRKLLENNLLCGKKSSEYWKQQQLVLCERERGKFSHFLSQWLLHRWWLHFCVTVCVREKLGKNQIKKYISWNFMVRHKIAFMREFTRDFFDLSSFWVNINFHSNAVSSTRFPFMSNKCHHHWFFFCFHFSSLKERENIRQRRRVV